MCLQFQANSRFYAEPKYIYSCSSSIQAGNTVLWISIGGFSTVTKLRLLPYLRKGALKVKNTIPNQKKRKRTGVLGIPSSVTSSPKVGNTRRGEEACPPPNSADRVAECAWLERRELGEMFVRKKVNILTMSETKLKGKRECELANLMWKVEGIRAWWSLVTRRSDVFIKWSFG